MGRLVELELEGGGSVFVEVQPSRGRAGTVTRGARTTARARSLSARARLWRRLLLTAVGQVAFGSDGSWLATGHASGCRLFTSDGLLLGYAGPPLRAAFFS